MKAKKINMKKIISYLLIFTVFFTTIQIGSVKKASAAEETQIPGLIFHVGDLDSKEEKIIDKDSDGKYVCEYLRMGESFTLEPETGYDITAVTSSNAGKMKIIPGTNTAGNNFTVSSITDYSDFTLTVTMKNTKTNESITYPIQMSFEIDSSLLFDKLQVTYDNDEPITIPFASTIDGKYVLNADGAANKATIKLLDSNSTEIACTVNGGSSNVVTLVGGKNTITITRKSLGISKDYTLIINKRGNAKLEKLVPSTGTLSPAFDSDIFDDYQITVPTTESTIAFTPTSVDSSSTIKVDGSTVKSGNKSKNISLDEGKNEIEVVVKTDDDTNTYNIVVTRTEKPRSSQLTSLNLTSGTLSPTFNKGIYEYTATVENTVTSIGVTPVAVDAEATIQVNGNKIPSGATTPNIRLDEGGNVIKVKVTDSKGDSETYVLTIIRKYPKGNANLSALSVTDGTMSPLFDSDTYMYSVKVARNIERVKVKFTGQNDKIKIKIGEQEYTSGQQSDFINLKIGANLVKVAVVGEDGKSTVTYMLSIIRGDIEGTNQWVVVAGEWTFYNGAGIQIKNQWVKYDNQWYFLDINGHRKTGWILESGKWFYLNKDGIMQTGWFYDKGYWYYLQGDGAMRVDTWATYDGKWYLFNALGEMQTGWTFYKGRWYYMDEHGAQQKGWITYDKNKYYINDDGTLKNGWLYNGKSWFYLGEGGKMVRGWQTIDGKRYYFDTNGIMKTGMMFLDGQWINLNNA